MQGFSKTTRENGKSVTSSNPPQTETSSPAPTPGARYGVSDTRPRWRSYLREIWKKAKNLPVHTLSACTDDDSYRRPPHEWPTNNEHPPGYECPRACGCPPGYECPRACDCPPGYEYPRVCNRPPAYEYPRVCNCPPSYEYSRIRHHPPVRDDSYSVDDCSSIGEHMETESPDPDIPPSSPMFTSSTGRDPTMLLTPGDVFSCYIPSGLRRTYT
jgi:hypothetical protein